MTLILKKLTYSQHHLVLFKHILIVYFLQDPLYQSLNRAVNSTRDLMGVPDEPKWNSVLFGGVIGSLFSFLQFLASPIVGATSDVYGRRPLLVVTMVG